MTWALLLPAPRRSGLPGACHVSSGPATGQPASSRPPRPGAPASSRLPLDPSPCEQRVFTSPYVYEGSRQPIKANASCAEPSPASDQVTGPRAGPVSSAQVPLVRSGREAAAVTRQSAFGSQLGLLGRESTEGTRATDLFLVQTHRQQIGACLTLRSGAGVKGNGQGAEPGLSPSRAVEAGEHSRGI